MMSLMSNAFFNDKWYYKGNWVLNWSYYGIPSIIRFFNEYIHPAALFGLLTTVALGLILYALMLALILLGNAAMALLVNLIYQKFWSAYQRARDEHEKEPDSSEIIDNGGSSTSGGDFTKDIELILII